MVQQKEVLQDWVRVEDFEVDPGTRRTFEYHVVQDRDVGHITLTIKCLDGAARTIRLDPTVISADADPDSYPMLAERRVRSLFQKGMI